MRFSSLVLVLLGATVACGGGASSSTSDPPNGEPTSSGGSSSGGPTGVPSTGGALTALEQRMVGTWTMRRTTVRKNDEYLYFIFRSDGSGCYWEREYSYSASGIRKFSRFSLDESKKDDEGKIPILLDNAAGYKDAFRPNPDQNSGDAVFAFGIPTLRLTRDATKEDCPAK